MNNHLKSICVLVLIIVSLSSCSTKQPPEEPKSSADVPVLLLPFVTAATFTGFIPCDDCVRVDVSLTIHPDTMYQLRKTYRQKEGPAKIEAQVGKWVYLPKDRLLILGKQKGLLKTYFIENDNTLKFVEWEGTDNASQIQYQLIRSDKVDPFEDIVKISGKFSVVNGVGNITECTTEQSFAVRNGKDYSTLLQNYMNTPHDRGQPLLTNILAKFVHGQGGQSELIIEHFGKISPEIDCQGRKISSSLTGTLWRLTEVDGLEVTKIDGGGIPYLLLNSDRSFRAHGGCNEITGNYLFKGDLFMINRKPAIRLGCVKGLTIENKFIEALDNADSLSVDGEILELRDKSDRVRARLKVGM